MYLHCLRLFIVEPRHQKGYETSHNRRGKHSCHGNNHGIPVEEPFSPSFHLGRDRDADIALGLRRRSHGDCHMLYHGRGGGVSGRSLGVWGLGESGVEESGEVAADQLGERGKVEVRVSREAEVPKLRNMLRKTSRKTRVIRKCAIKYKCSRCTPQLCNLEMAMQTRDSKIA